MASFTPSRTGRRDAKTISARILTGIVRLDFALLLIAAWLAAIGVGAWLQAPLRGLLALAATIGAGTGCIVLASQGAYALDRLRAPRSQIWLRKVVVLAASALIAGLFLVNVEARQLRAFPFAFGASALLLLASFHLGLRALIRRWTKAGRFAVRWMNFSWQRSRKSPKVAAREKAPSRRSRRINVVKTCPGVIQHGTAGLLRPKRRLRFPGRPRDA